MKKTVFREEAETIDREAAGSDVSLISLRAPQVAAAARPGQFVMIRPMEGWEHALMRPISVCEAAGGVLRLLIREAGKGTRRLCRMQPGQKALIVGPLGNGFRLEAGRRLPVCLVAAGGIGVAPMPLLAQKLLEMGRDVHVILGARTRAGLLMRVAFGRLGCKLTIATDDGTEGFFGTVCDAVVGALDSCEREGRRAEVFACGPEPMLGKLSAMARQRKLRCQVSVEQRMACGKGACLGCALKMRDGTYRMVCTDGPVFEAEEVF